MFRPCVVVPVFNHGREAVQLTERLRAFGLPIILIDDGSEAKCAAILDDLARASEAVKVLRHAVNQGKGGAVLTGLACAHDRGFSHALQIDADGQHDVRDVPRFLAAAARDPDALIAGQPQFDSSAPRSRTLGRHICNFWIRVETLSGAIGDAMCGFRVYPLESVMRLAAGCRLGRRMDFDVEILVKLYWSGVAVVPIATQVTYPAGGRSNFRMVQDNWLLTKLHTRLFFGMVRQLHLLLARKGGLAQMKRSGAS